MDAEWFYLEDGQQRGPVSHADLLPLLRKLPRGTLVWRDGLGDWRAAEEVEELAAQLVAPPSPAPPPPPLPPAPPRPSSALGAERGDASGVGGGVSAGPGVARSASSPRTTPAATARPAYRPTTTQAARRSGAPGPATPADPETLNPFVLWRRSFSFGGGFNRVEFAIAHFGILLLCFVALLGIGAVAAVTGREPSEGGQMVLGLAAIVMVPILLIIQLGSSVRRLHDLGQTGWLVLVMFLPCVNLLLLVYLLAAPSSAGAGEAGPRAPVSAPSGVSWVIIAVVAVFGGIMLIGMVAAIAIPSLLRARISANEAGTVGDIRSVISGQAAYSSMNGGFYESRLECLAQPAQCIANSTAPGVVPAETTSATRTGYSRELVTSPLGADLPSGISPSSVTSYAFVAYPLKPGQTGVRSFCGDHTGRVCFDPEGGRSLVDQTETEVVCAATCQDVR